MIMLIAQIVIAIIVFVYIGDLQVATEKVLRNLWGRRTETNGRQVWEGIESTVSNFDYTTYRQI